MGGAEIRISDPVVSFRETVNQMSDHIVMSKSPNKHNRCASANLPAEHQGLALLQYLPRKLSCQSTFMRLHCTVVFVVDFLPGNSAFPCHTNSFTCEKVCSQVHRVCIAMLPPCLECWCNVEWHNAGVGAVIAFEVEKAGGRRSVDFEEACCEVCSFWRQVWPLLTQIVDYCYSEHDNSTKLAHEHHIGATTAPKGILVFLCCSWAFLV